MKGFHTHTYSTWPDMIGSWQRVCVCVYVCVYVPVHAYSMCVCERGTAGIMLVAGNPQREVAVGHGLQRLNYTAWWVPLSVTPLAESKHTNKIWCLCVVSRRADDRPSTHTQGWYGKRRPGMNTTLRGCSLYSNISSGFRHSFHLYQLNSHHGKYNAYTVKLCDVFQ